MYKPHSDKCERCGYNYLRKDEDDDVCIVCLHELELEHSGQLDDDDADEE